MARRVQAPSLWTGTDRIRVGQRLRASLAGLHELEVLRKKHGDGVRILLQGPEEQASTEQGEGILEDLPDRSPDGEKCQQKRPMSQTWQPRKQKLPEPGKGVLMDQERAKLDRSHSEDILGSKEKPHTAYCSSEALDAGCSTKASTDGTMHTAFGFGYGRLAENGFGSRLRLGSSSVLTDHMMFSKRLTVATEPSLTPEDHREVMDTDSRPSSGFYETSEMDTCSLSTSCTSVYSEGPQGSCWSMDSLCHLPAFCEVKSARPHSTDEAAFRLMDLRLQRLMASTHPMSSQHIDSRRPVSTGDLDFIPTLQTLGDFRSLGLRPLPYTCDLVSRNTSEVYHYPSPLHAVALQSPLFIGSPSCEDLTGAITCTPVVKEQQPSLPHPLSEDLQRCRLDRYIAKLVLQHRCRSVASGLAMSRSELGSLVSHQKSLSMSSIYSSPLSGAPQVRSGMKARRRISTCFHLKSPEGSASSRDSERSRDSVISLDTGSSVAEDAPVGTHPEQYPPDWGKEVEHTPALEDLEELESSEHIHRLVLVPQRTPLVLDGLYKGRHSSRELVKPAVLAPERRWLNPKEVLRRLSLRRKPNNSRCASEMNVSGTATMFPHPDSLCRCSSCLSVPAARWKAHTNVRQQWTSALEISGSHSDSPRRLNGELCRGPAFSSLSSEYCCDRPEQKPTRECKYHLCSGTSLSEADLSSNSSLINDWNHHRHLWGGTPCHVSASIDTARTPTTNGKLHRTRSFKELKKKVCRSMSSFHVRGSNR